MSLTSNAPTSITSAGFTLSAEVGGTPPAGSVMQIQWTVDPLTGPWVSSHPTGTYPSAVVGTFSHTFVGAPSSTPIYWRAFVFTVGDPAVVHFQTPNETFNTLTASPVSTAPPAFVTPLAQTAATNAANSAAPTQREQAYIDSLISSIGTNCRRRLLWSAVEVVNDVVSGSASRSGSQLLVPALTSNALASVDVSVGSGIHRVENAGDSSVYIETIVGNSGSGLSGVLSANTVAGQPVTLSQAVFNSPALNAVPVAAPPAPVFPPIFVGDSVPTTLSATRVTQLMSTSGAPGVTPNLQGRGYQASAFGGHLGVGAALKHNRINNASWLPDLGVNTYCPAAIGWRDRLAQIYIDWLTVGHVNAPPSSHNQAFEARPMGAWGRIRPSLNGGNRQWLAINNPTGALYSELILTGASLGPGASRANGTIMRLHETFTVHPWAITSPPAPQTGNEVDANIFNIAAINPADPFSESRLDCIVSSWWVRAVPWNPALPLGNITSNPIIAVAAADPYVNRSMLSGGQIGVDCASAIGASPYVTLTTQWQQISYMTSLDAPDKHTTFTDAGITNAEFLTALPPGYV